MRRWKIYFRAAHVATAVACLAVASGPVLADHETTPAYAMHIERLGRALENVEYEMKSANLNFLCMGAIQAAYHAGAVHGMAEARSPRAMHGDRRIATRLVEAVNKCTAPESYIRYDPSTRINVDFEIIHESTHLNRIR